MPSNKIKEIEAKDFSQVTEEDWKTIVNSHDHFRRNFLANKHGSTSVVGDIPLDDEAVANAKFAAQLKGGLKGWKEAEAKRLLAQHFPVEDIPDEVVRRFKDQAAEFKAKSSRWERDLKDYYPDQGEEGLKADRNEIMSRITPEQKAEFLHEGESISELAPHRVKLLMGKLEPKESTPVPGSTQTPSQQTSGNKGAQKIPYTDAGKPMVFEYDPNDIMGSAQRASLIPEGGTIRPMSVAAVDQLFQQGRQS